MAHATKAVAGYDCNILESKAGEIRSAVVLVGPADQPGWRAKDGSEARRLRREAKRAVMAALDLPAKSVRVSARYSELTETSPGVVHRRAPNGQVLGAYL